MPRDISSDDTGPVLPEPIPHHDAPAPGARRRPGPEPAGDGGLEEPPGRRTRRRRPPADGHPSGRPIDPGGDRTGGGDRAGGSDKHASAGQDCSQDDTSQYGTAQRGATPHNTGRRETPRRGAPPRRGGATRGSGAPRSDEQEPSTATPPPHGHGHKSAAPASRRVRILLASLLAPFALAALAAVALLYPWGQPDVSGHAVGDPVHGDVVSSELGPCLSAGQVQVGDPGDDGRCQTVGITLTDGPAEGRTITQNLPAGQGNPTFAPGDAVVLAYSGADPQAGSSYQVQDFQRGLPLALLAGLFALAVVVLGRWRGLAALGALAVTAAIIGLFVLPAILHGADPLLVAIAGAGLIMFVALYTTHGFSARTSAAVLGTMVSLALIGLLSAVFAGAARLTGLDESTSTLIGSLGHGIDARGLLLAGIVIGALGVLDDVTVTQASAVWELHRANPRQSWRELYVAALRIGRDHVGSAVNTLVMAYAGAALPALLLASLSDIGLESVLASQELAAEIVRTLSGSIGIIAAVPVTTLLAALIVVREETPGTSPAQRPVPTDEADVPRRRVTPATRRTGSPPPS